MPDPISAILPIYNCRERLERHLQSVKTWADLVEEIIVVDSGSSDGSLEVAREVLTRFRVKFLHNPPGLYQSWNAGIAAASAPWCYISTVEDPITPEGLHHLLEIANKYGSDVVVSPPEMRSEDGSAPVAKKMPSNFLAEAFRSSGLTSRLLERSESIALLCGLFPHGLLGSSASNLYRTSFLQSHPFPTDVGHCGDTAWGAKVAPHARLAITATTCSQFFCQTKHANMSREQQLQQFNALSKIAADSLQTQASKDQELAIVSGWLKAHFEHSGAMWQMLKDHEVYEQHLRSKYEGGIFQYLRRAFIDEWNKLCKK